VNQTVPTRKPFSPMLVAVTMIALLLALVSIFFGVNQLTTSTEQASFYLGMGFVILAVAVYMLFQTRQRMLRIMSLETQPISSTLQCQKCGFKNVREFKRGDFVFKQTDEQCPKDQEKMTISAIYREVKDKEKAKEESFS